jgi:hypothetical protein
MIQKGGLLIDFAFAWFYSVVMREGGIIVYQRVICLLACVFATICV